MNNISRDEKLQSLLQVITNQPDACELKWSLFYSAVLSGNPSAIKPCPPRFVDRTSNDLQDSILEAAQSVPAFEDLHRTSQSLPDDVIELLHWTLIQCRDPRLRRITQTNYPPHLQKVLADKPPSQWPQYVFEVLPNTESNAEKKFQQHKAELDTGAESFAFHGSKLESFFSILNFGLAQHMCKRDLYGDGVYLSTALDVAMNFSSTGSSWPKSHLLGDSASCVALCEYVPNPVHIRTDPKKIPKSYIVLTNNEFVRVRYLLVFTKVRRRKHGACASGGNSWSPGIKLTMGVIFYLALLGIVGIYNRASFLGNHS